MRTTSGIRIGLSALVTAGALGAASLAPAAAAPEPAPEQASIGLLTAMQEDLGLTAKQARVRLSQETAAIEAAPKAERAAGSAYAGSWFDAEAGKLTVAVSSRSKVDEVRAADANAEVVRHDADTLERTKKALDRRSADQGAPAGVSSWHVDPESNSVVIKVVEDSRKDADVRKFLDRAENAGPVSVEADVTEAPDTLAAGTVGGDPYYTGNVRCSIGFSVHGGFVTAGHCGQTGASVRGWDNSQIGDFRGSSFPGDDMAWVSVGHGWWTTPVVLGWGTTSDRLVRGSAEAPIGASVCRSGSTTGWHCGTVLGKNETVNYGGGAQVRQLTRTSVCAEPGDSGGSFISGDQAQGVTSGGWGNCSGGGETWHQPVNEILNRYGLSLVTA